MAKKDNELAFSAEGGNAEKLKALQAAMDKIEKSFVQIEEKVTVCIVEGEFSKW